jgi:hypothetical protein
MNLLLPEFNALVALFIVLAAIVCMAIYFIYQRK